MSIWAKWAAWAKWGEGETPSYSISGTIEDGDAAAIEGVTVTLSGDQSDSTTTDANGDYSFDVPNGDYTITPEYSVDAYTFSFAPTSTNVTVDGGDQTGKDFTGTAAFTYPMVFNANTPSHPAGIEIGDTGAELQATKYFTTIWGDTPSIQVDGYADIDECYNDLWTTGLWFETNAGGGIGCNMPAGCGITPSDGELLRVEMMAAVSGLTAALWIYIDDHNGVSWQNGVRAGVNASTLQIGTGGSGSWTNKVNVAHSISGLTMPSPTMLRFELNLSTLAYQIRVNEFGKVTQRNSGWKTGTISSPTYVASAEWVRIRAWAQTSAVGDGQIFSMWVDKAETAWPGGSLTTHNFTELP